MEDNNPIPENQTQPALLSQSSTPLQTIKQKGYFLPIIGAVVILFTIAGGAYYFMRVKSSTAIPAQTQTVIPTTQPSTIDETANWKTYTNSKYGYTLKYPSNWSLVEQLSGSYIDIYDQPNITQPQLHDGSWVKISISNDERQGRIQPSDSIGTKKEIANKVFEEKIADITLDKYSAFKTVSDILSGSQTDARPTTNIVAKIDSNTFVISFSNPDKNQYEKDLNIFNEIISTFKFNNQINADISNWRTYTTSSEFTFKYPSDWTITPDTYKYDYVSLRSPDYSVNTDGIETLDKGVELMIYTETTPEASIDKKFEQDRFAGQIANSKTYTTVYGQRAIQYDYSYENTQATDTIFIKRLNDSVGMHYLIKLRYADSNAKSKYWSTYLSILESFKGL